MQQLGKWEDVGGMPRVVAQGKASIEEADEVVGRCHESPFQQLVADPARARCGFVQGRGQGRGELCQGDGSKVVGGERRGIIRLCSGNRGTACGEEVVSEGSIHLRGDARDIAQGGAQWLDVRRLPAMLPTSSLPKVMDIRLKEEFTTPIVFGIEDSTMEGRGSQLPLSASAGLDDGESGGARISPPLDPMGVGVAAGFKQGGAHLVNVS